MKVIGVNGIRSDGAKNTDRLLAKLQKLGSRIYDFNYRRVSLCAARSRSRQDAHAKRLKSISFPGDAVVAHSYGCLLTLRAMQLGAQFSSVFFFAPALSSKITLPPYGCDNLYVIHNRSDWAILFGAMLFFHDFGTMGRIGYQGRFDPRIRNVSASYDDAQGLWNHSYYFKKDNIDKWAEFVANNSPAQAVSRVEGLDRTVDKG